MSGKKDCRHANDELVTNGEGLQELRCTACDERLAWESICDKSDYHSVFGNNERLEQKLRNIVWPKDNPAAA